MGTKISSNHDGFADTMDAKVLNCSAAVARYFSFRNFARMHLQQR